MYTYLIDKLPSLVGYMNTGSSIIADKLIHELGHTFSTFPYQGLRLNKFTCVVYAGDDSVGPLLSLRQVGDEIDAKLSPGFKRYMYSFQLISSSIYHCHIEHFFTFSCWKYCFQFDRDSPADSLVLVLG